MIIWIDGSGWNGKVSKLAVVFEDGRVIQRSFEEEKTNNEMEYASLLIALQEAQNEDEIRSDSQLVVNQVLGTWKVKKGHLRPLRDECSKTVNEKKIKLIWVPREENKAGHLLERS